MKIKSLGTMSLPENVSNFTFVHIARCGGLTVRQVLYELKMLFTLVHLRKPDFYKERQTKIIPVGLGFQR